MKLPRVAFLVHGGPGSIEAVRARGLATDYPSDRIRFLWREGSRPATAARWHAELRRDRPDVAYVLNTAMPGAPLACFWRRFHGLPFVLDTGDAVYEMARLSGVGAGFRLPLLKVVENAAQSHAATVVVRGTRHREHLHSLGIRRVELIRDGHAPQQSVDPSAVAALRRRLGLEGRFIAGVMGSLVHSPRLGICYGWDLVQALSQLRDRPVTGLVIGDGNGMDWLRRRAADLGVADRVVFAGRIPYAEVPTYLRLMDVALSTQTNNLPGRVRTTGKVPEYMAAGCFVLASRVGEAELLLPGIMLVDYDGEVDPAYPGRLAERIRQLEANRELLSVKSTLPRTAARLCSYPVLSAEFRRVVSEAADLP